MKEIYGQCRQYEGDIRSMSSIGRWGAPVMPTFSPVTVETLCLHIMLIHSIVSKTDLCCRLEILGLDLATSQRDDNLGGQVRAQGSHCRAKTIQIPHLG
jgi:hypothetical protein